MLGGDLFSRFLDSAPVCVMVRATLEKMFSAEALDDLFSGQAQDQYERELLFSSVVDVMSLVVCRVHPSVHAAYQHKRESIPVSVKSLYNKLNGIEPGVSRALLRRTADMAAEVMDRWGPRRSLLPGYRIQVWDGNHLTGTEHRLEVLRAEGAAALPGVAVAVLDPQRGIIEDVVVAEDAYVQETQLAPPLLERIQPRDVVIVDRQYCTSHLLFGIAARGGFFVARQHLGHLSWKLIGRRRCRGRTETGTLYEQDVELTHPQTKQVLRVRRITVKLDQPTRDGDEELHVLTNLPQRVANAPRVAGLYRQRWTVETAFQQLTVELRCELTSLGYPPAALFTFCVAAACYNAFAVIQAALGSVHGQDAVDQDISTYYLTDELSGTYRGMMIALPPENWKCFQDMPPAQFAGHLQHWARQVKLARYQKRPRGPKTRIQRPYAPTKHVATARLLNPQNYPP